MDYLLFAAGFACGFLVIRGIRSFWTLGACFALLAGPGVQAGTYIHNGANSSYVAQLHAGANTNCSGTLIYNGPIAAGQTVDITGAVTAGSTYTLCSGPSGTYSFCEYSVALNHTYEMCTAIPPSHTNFVSNFTFTNTAAWAQTYQLWTVSAATGLPVSTNWLTVEPGVQSVSMTNALGPDVGFSWVVFGPRGPEFDFLPGTIISGSAAGTASGSSDPSDMGVVGGTPITSFGRIPESFSNIPTNALIADRVNAQGIIDAIGQSANQQTLQLLSSLGAGFGNLGSGLTNSAGSDTNSLEELRKIKTNTLVSADYAKYQTNLQGWLSVASNRITRTIMEGTIGYASNGVKAAWELMPLKGSFDSVTNGLVTEGLLEEGVGPITDPDDSTWKLNLALPKAGDPSHSKSLSMNPFAALGGALSVKLVAIAGWVRYWVTWAIVVVAFWLGCHEISERFDTALILSANVAVPAFGLDDVAAVMAGGVTGGLSAVYSVLKKAIPVVLTVFITVAIGLMPTTLFAMLLNWGYGPLLFQGPEAYLNSVGIGQGLGSKMLELLAWCNVFFPLHLMAIALVNLIVFRFVAWSLLVVVATLMRAMIQAEKNSTVIDITPGDWNVLPWGVGLALLLGSQTVQGAKVQVENWTPESVGMTNVDLGVAFSFPPGVVQVNLEAGLYSYGTNGYEVELTATDNLQIVRYVSSVDTNSPSVLASQSQARCEEDWFLYGFGLGFGVFGASWAVSVFRQGIKTSVLGGL